MFVFVARRSYIVKVKKFIRITLDSFFAIDSNVVLYIDENVDMNLVDVKTLISFLQNFRRRWVDDLFEAFHEDLEILIDIEMLLAVLDHVLLYMSNT